MFNLQRLNLFHFSGAWSWWYQARSTCGAFSACAEKIWGLRRRRQGAMGRMCNEAGKVHCNKRSLNL